MKTLQLKVKKIIQENGHNVLIMSPVDFAAGQQKIHIVATDAELPTFTRGTLVEVSFKATGNAGLPSTPAPVTVPQEEELSAEAEENLARADEISSTMSKEKIEKKLSKLKEEFPASASKDDLAHLLADTEDKPK